MSDEVAPLTEEPPRRGVVRVLRLAAGTACLALVVAGTILRLTVRDRYYPFSIAYYVLPIGVLAALSWFAVLLFPKGTVRKVALVAAIFSAALWGGSGWSFRSISVSPESVKIAFWNCARGMLGWEGVIARVKAFDADVIGLVETDLMPRPAASWRAALPDRSVAVLPYGLTLIVRGKIEAARQVPLREGCYALALDVVVRGEPLRMVIVDIYSAPAASRAIPLKRLAARIPNDGRPTIVMGDFNTPPESVWFDPLRERFSNAFEVAGQGYGATWPLPFPVLTLDQIWGDERCRFEECRHLWTTRSDHRPVWCQVRIVRDEGDAEAR